MVAEERAKFGLPEVKRGLIAAAGGVFRIVDHLPRKVALELMFTGEPMTSADALQWGLINQVVPDGTAVDAALALAERITVNAPLAVQASKRVASASTRASSPTTSPAGTRTIARSARCCGPRTPRRGRWRSPEKRSPVWKARYARRPGGLRRAR